MCHKKQSLNDVAYLMCTYLFVVSEREFCFEEINIVYYPALRICLH